MARLREYRMTQARQTRLVQNCATVEDEFDQLDQRSPPVLITNHYSPLRPGPL
jgi:hypothetical protein